MTTLEDTIETTLEADSTITTTATGGVHTFSDIDRLGAGSLKRAKTLGLVDANGVFKPFIILKLRESTPDLQIVDTGTGTRSARGVLEIYFYDDGDAGYDTIQTLRDRVYTLINDQSFSSQRLQWVRDMLRRRDFAQDLACYELAEYEVRYIRG